ncbi:hypothetical protein ACUXCC_001801 [Cytobacillus horneckiae]|uniref:Uncharacterized protein n=1 Tax=Cytobacillus horneckiae TaxID=549687 RepID=A0A2N0ZIH0_9BACI|nr:hypothetical protein [Cytobacillus horneckiae]MBN6886729.1 hypothetical protein [Cytobacillus horneckiae]MCM3177799.1 hypothetical protein [Cytobacillus horneckiae]MEC1157395.1 hypothetical protein [Cytobacillus horneckiae]MED2935724.1 hypothetical protein [Cytobacillus horneckiae]PKG29315.1 hypothetical protein CWS20_08555 [Cytobacillus horneckiae]
MQMQSQTSQNTEIVTKREISTRIFLNMYGLLTFIGWMLSIFTIPVSVNEHMEFFYNKELILKTNEIKDFLVFLFCSALIYFSVVNVYFKRKK